jgi:Ca2+-dependent lipid-binding protein
MLPSFLYIQVAQAKDLPRPELFGSTDPFVTLSLNGVQLKTRVIKNAVSPTWNEVLIFQDEETKFAWREQELTVQVCNRSFWGPAKVLGTTTLQVLGHVRRCHDEHAHQTLPLRTNCIIRTRIKHSHVQHLLVISDQHQRQHQHRQSNQR